MLLYIGALAALLLAASGVAEARMHHPYRGHRIVPVATAPLDGFTTPSGAYSFRLLRQAYLGTGAAVRLRRASDNAEADIGFDGSGNFDLATATAHCAATTCFIRTWYDQSGLARHLVQTTAANQPQLVFACNGTLPCFRTTVNTQNLSSVASITPATGIVSFSVVANRSNAATGFCSWLRQNGIGNRITTNNILNQWIVVGGTSGNVTSAASVADGAWHSAQATINGASSSLSIDGVNATGTTTGNTVAGTAQINGGAGSTNCDFGEAVVWDNYVLTAGEVAALRDNQKNYYTPLPLDTFTAPSGAYSFRKLKSTYSGPAIRIRRASDNAETDINFLGFVPGLGAPWDVAAANAHCAATSCFIKTIYDQSGNARHLTQATVANQPGLRFGCLGSNGCADVGPAPVILASGSATPATGVASLSAVANRISGTGGCLYARQNGSGTAQRLTATNAVANSVGLAATSGSVTVTMADAAWHSLVGSVNGVSSSLTVDGVTTTGNVIGGVVAGALNIAGGVAGTCSLVEMIIWDNLVLTPAEVAGLTANQRSFWGF